MMATALVIAAAVTLSIAVLAGATLARRHVRAQPVARTAAYGHAAMAVIGTGVLLVAIVLTTQSLFIHSALLLLVLTLCGGAFMLTFRLQHEPIPGLMITLHAGMALVSLGLVWVGVVQLL